MIFEYAAVQIHLELGYHILLTIEMIEDGEVTPFIVVTGHGMDIEPIFLT